MAKFLGQVVSIVAANGMCETHLGNRTLVLGASPKIGDFLFQSENKIYIGGDIDIENNEEAKERFELLNGAKNAGNIPLENSSNKELEKLSISQERQALIAEAEEFGIKVQNNMKDETIRKKIAEARMKLLAGDEGQEDQKYEEQDNV